MAQVDKKNIDTLLEGTHFTAKEAGEMVIIKHVENGKYEYVTDGTPAQIVEFLELWHWHNDRLKASLARGSIFLEGTRK
jgi:hypothetical protein